MMQPQEAVLQTPAFEVVVEFAPGILRQFYPRFRQMGKNGVTMV